MEYFSTKSERISCGALSLLTLEGSIGDMKKDLKIEEGRVYSDSFSVFMY